MVIVDRFVRTGCPWSTIDRRCRCSSAVRTVQRNRKPCVCVRWMRQIFLGCSSMDISCSIHWFTIKMARISRILSGRISCRFLPLLKVSFHWNAPISRARVKWSWTFCKCRKDFSFLIFFVTIWRRFVPFSMRLNPVTIEIFWNWSSTNDSTAAEICSTPVCILQSRWPTKIIHWMKTRATIIIIIISNVSPSPSIFFIHRTMPIIPTAVQHDRHPSNSRSIHGHRSLRIHRQLMFHHYRRPQYLRDRRVVSIEVSPRVRARRHPRHCLRKFSFYKIKQPNSRRRQGIILSRRRFVRHGQVMQRDGHRANTTKERNANVPSRFFVCFWNIPCFKSIFSRCWAFEISKDKLHSWLLSKPGGIIVLWSSSNMHWTFPNVNRRTNNNNRRPCNFFLDFSSTEDANRSSSNLLLRMIYPLTSTHSDYSPLYTICTNDTCSFTWTGEEHISQAIFECKTCGLEGTLCCCSECAQTCHKGHDCRLKRTSPTAYCDCWEVCKCKALINGDQQKRLELFKLLLNETNLVQIKNARYENLLLYLVQTVGRQLIEQQQFPRTSTAAMLQQQARKTREQMGNSGAATMGGSSQPSKKLPHHPSGASHSQPASNPLDFESNSQMSSIPDHHLEPPQFCKWEIGLWCVRRRDCSRSSSSWIDSGWLVGSEVDVTLRLSWWFRSDQCRQSCFSSVFVVSTDDLALLSWSDVFSRWPTADQPIGSFHLFPPGQMQQHQSESFHEFQSLDQQRSSRYSLEHSLTWNVQQCTSWNGPICHITFRS